MGRLFVVIVEGGDAARRCIVADGGEGSASAESADVFEITSTGRSASDVAATESLRLFFFCANGELKAQNLSSFCLAKSRSQLRFVCQTINRDFFLACATLKLQFSSFEIATAEKWQKKEKKTTAKVILSQTLEVANRRAPLTVAICARARRHPRHDNGARPHTMRRAIRSLVFGSNGARAVAFAASQPSVLKRAPLVDGRCERRAR